MGTPPAATSAGAPSRDARKLGSHWVNDRGTAIELVGHDDGRVTGTIRLASDGTAYKPYVLRGTVVVRPEGDSGVVATLLGWPLVSAATVWVGELDPTGTVLTTRLLVADGSVPAIDWEPAMGGSVFRRNSDRRRRA